MRDGQCWKYFVKMMYKIGDLLYLDYGGVVENIFIIEVNKERYKLHFSYSGMPEWVNKETVEMFCVFITGIFCE